MPASGSNLFRLRKGAVRRALPGILLTVLAISAYVFYLNNQERNALAHFAKIRKDNASQYLNEIRQVQGFSTYIKEYSKLQGFNTYKPTAPAFLLGRWALFKKPQHVSDKFTSNICKDSLLIENGRITMPPDKTPQVAQYRLDGTSLWIKPQAGADIRINLISAGIYLHHLEIKNSEGKTVAYGYRCT